MILSTETTTENTNTMILSINALKELDANIEQAAMLSGNEEVIKVWSERPIMKCNGTLINDLIRLARCFAVTL